jgi:hypothetical protein
MRQRIAAEFVCRRALCCWCCFLSRLNSFRTVLCMLYSIVLLFVRSHSSRHLHNSIWNSEDRHAATGCVRSSLVPPIPSMESSVVQRSCHLVGCRCGRSVYKASRMSVHRKGLGTPRDRSSQLLSVAQKLSLAQTHQPTVSQTSNRRTNGKTEK